MTIKNAEYNAAANRALFVSGLGNGKRSLEAIAETAVHVMSSHDMTQFARYIESAAKKGDSDAVLRTQDIVKCLFPGCEVSFNKKTSRANVKWSGAVGMDGECLAKLTEFADRGVNFRNAELRKTFKPAKAKKEYDLDKHAAAFVASAVGNGASLEDILAAVTKAHAAS